MAALYMRPTPWPVGTTVAVYLGSVASGAPVTTTVVRDDDSVLVLGLTVGAPYIAVGSGQSVVFTLGATVDPGGGGSGVDQTARDAAAAAQATADAAQPAASAATDSELATHAGTTGLGQHIPSGGITNTEVASAASIAESKLSLASDAAAGTASRRTLGVGATQAAAGNHRHSSPADLGSGTPSAGKYLDGGGSWLTMGVTPNGSGEYINIQRAPYSASSNSDITTVLQQVAADINAGSQPTYTVRIPGRGYTNTALIDFTKTVKWQGDGPGMTDLQMSGSAAEIRFRGSIGSAVNVTANVANNAITLSFPTAGFAAGDIIVLRDNQVWPWSTAGTGNNNHGEMLEIESINDSSSVTLKTPTTDSYTIGTPSGSTPSVKKITVIDTPSIEGMKIWTPYAPRTTDVNIGGVRFLYAKDPSLESVRFEGFDQFASAWDTCFGGYASNTDIEDGYWDTASGRWSYGHLMRGPTRNVIISNSRSRNAQLVNGGGDNNGGPRAIQVNGCVMTGAQKDLFGTDGWKPMLSTHGDNMAWQFNDILIDGGRYGGSVDTAVEVKGSDHVYNNLAVRNVTTTGVFCLAQSSRLRFNNPDISDINGTAMILSQDSIVSGGSIRDCDSRGVRVDGSGVSLKGLEVRNAGRTGNRVAVYLNTGANNAHIDKLTVRDMPTAGSLVVDGVAGLTGVAIDDPRRFNVNGGAGTNVSAFVRTGGTYTL